MDKLTIRKNNLLEKSKIVNQKLDLIINHILTKKSYKSLFDDFETDNPDEFIDYMEKNHHEKLLNYPGAIWKCPPEIKKECEINTYQKISEEIRDYIERQSQLDNAIKMTAKGLNEIRSGNKTKAEEIYFKVKKIYDSTDNGTYIKMTTHEPNSDLAKDWRKLRHDFSILHEELSKKMDIGKEIRPNVIKEQVQQAQTVRKPLAPVAKSPRLTTVEQPKPLKYLKTKSLEPDTVKGWEQTQQVQQVQQAQTVRTTLAPVAKSPRLTTVEQPKPLEYLQTKSIEPDTVKGGEQTQQVQQVQQVQQARTAQTAQTAQPTAQQQSDQQNEEGSENGYIFAFWTKMKNYKPFFISESYFNGMKKHKDFKDHIIKYITDSHSKISELQTSKPYIFDLITQIGDFYNSYLSNTYTSTSSWFKHYEDNSETWKTFKDHIKTTSVNKSVFDGLGKSVWTKDLVKSGVNLILDANGWSSGGGNDSELDKE